MKYTVIFERTPASVGAYVPDLPGCVAGGDNQAEAESLIREAMRLHVQSLREHNEPVPDPGTSAAAIEIDAPDAPARRGRA